MPLDCGQKLKILLVLHLLVEPTVGLDLLQVVLVTHLVVLVLVVELLRKDVEVLVVPQTLPITHILQNLDYKDMPSYQQNFMNWGAIEVE